MRWALCLIAVTLAGCGGSPTSPSPTPIQTPSPTPAPVPTTQTARITITNTVSGAEIGAMTLEVARLPREVEVSAPGYLTRLAILRSLTQTVDLIPDAAPFSLAFYREFVRNDADTPGVMQPLRRLTQAPSIYLQSAGLSPAMVTTLEHAARHAVYEYSGRTMGVPLFESGPELRPDRTGWITIELVPVMAPDDTWCGLAFVGVAAGHVRLNVDPRFQDRSRPTGCYRPLAHVLAHEIGHAMGFFHVADTTSLMSGNRSLSHIGTPSAREAYHAGIAYKRPVGNRDVDSDPLTASLSAVRMVID